MINCVVNFFVYIADFATYPIISGIDRIRGLVQSILGFLGNQQTGASSLKEREIFLRISGILEKFSSFAALISL
ncbi:MAG: hypothetical protein IT584_00885 [Chlamydiae bacterium]|nr:hypothetical protein [Chlamydiota bacterium]